MSERVFQFGDPTPDLPEQDPEQNPTREDGRWPGFKAQTGREPVAGQDFSDDAPLCQDDYEFLTGTGRYYHTEEK